jgi:hypothetical protein
MEIIGERGPFARFAAGSLGSERFMLFDVGCSGGIDGIWRLFGERLSSIGFDPSVAEIARLRGLEPSPEIVYEAAFVGVPDDHPIRLRRGQRPFTERNPWNRLTAARTVEIMADEIKAASEREKMQLNVWGETELTTAPTVFLPEFIQSRGIGSIDFIKIDIDSCDFDVLQSLEGDLAGRQVLGLGLEVNFYGSDNDTDHTFHNTDRFMRAQGFELFGLTARSYSVAGLPHRFAHDFPAQAEAGRPYQGDALYLRDVCAPEMAHLAPTLSPEKLVKLAILYSIGGLQDHAAELLLAFRDRLAPILDVDRGLDLLASETSIGRERGWGYRELIAAYERNDRVFYERPAKPEPEPVTIRDEEAERTLRAERDESRARADDLDARLIKACDELTAIHHSRRYRVATRFAHLAWKLRRMVGG